MTKGWWGLLLGAWAVLGVCCAAPAGAGNNDYTIIGDASAVTKQGKALLWRLGPDSAGIEEIARVPIEDGKFRIKGTVDWIAPAGVAILSSAEVDETLAKMDIIFEPGETRIVVRPYPQTSEVNGGPYYRQVFDSWARDPGYRAAAKQAADIMVKIGDKTPEDEVARLWKEGRAHEQEAARIQASILTGIIKASPDPLLRFLAEEQRWLGQAMVGISTDRDARVAALTALQKELPGYPAVSRTIARIKEGEKRAANAERIKVGTVIKDFSAPDIDGRDFRLSEVFKRQKYVLVEFWASWCGPCRAEIPNLKRAYESFHPKGFEIVSFSLDDKNIAWLKASDEEKLPWVNTSDLKAFQSPIVEMFGVSGIPTNYLVDQKGTIVGMNLRGEDLEKKLGELL